MTVRYFLDTNILLYAVAGHTDAPKKQARAVELINDEPFGTSTQVMQEFYSNASRKPAIPLNAAEALEWVEQLEQMEHVVIDIPLIKRAAELTERYKINYWDGAILASAEQLGATIVYSEDLNHGQLYGSVTVYNPFRDI